MTTAHPAADGHRIQVLLIGLGHYPNLPDRDLPGTQGDILAWGDVLTDLGVPNENIWLAHSQATGTPNPGVATLAYGLPPAQVSGGGLDDVGDLVKRFSEALGRDGAPEIDRVLVLWTGHGWAAPGGDLMLATADTAREGAGFVGLLPYDDLMTALDDRPATVNLTLVLDTCFAEAGPGHRGLNRTAPPVTVGGPRPRRESDVILCASRPGQKARELPVQKQMVGAFSWALTSLLSRWGRCADGAWFAITPNELATRASTMLFAMEIAQNPTVSGPAAELDRRILHRPKDLRAGGAPQGLSPIEIDPGNHGRVYDVTKNGGGSLGRLVVTTATKPLDGVPKNRVWWEDDIVGQSFSIGSSTLPGPQTTPSSRLYAATSFSSGTPPTPTGGGWKVTQGSDAFYMYYDGTDLCFVRPTSVSASIGAGAQFTWLSSLSLPSGGLETALDVSVA